MTSTLADSSSHTSARTHTGPLLVAVGENGLHVIRAAMALAPAFGDKGHVFSAIEPLPIEILSSEPVLVPPSFEEGRRETRMERLRARVDELVDPGRGWLVEVEHGEPAASICRRSRELDASLIVMGIGRHHPIDRIIAGETTLRVIRRASCPVLAVVGEFTHLPSKVVVATDFSPPSALAVEAVLPLLAEHATVHLMHVWEPSPGADSTVLEIEESYREALPGRFARFVSALHVPPGITVQTEIREGKTVPQILAFAESAHADLIVAGRHGMNAVARFFVGSITTGLVRGTTRSVLVTPEPTGPELDRLERKLNSLSKCETPEEWTRVLTDFVRRNKGRRARLEVDDPSLGARTEEAGYALLDACYVREDGRVELVFGEPHARTPHLTRTIPGVDYLSILADPTGRDRGLSLKHGEGHAVLTFMP